MSSKDERSWLDKKDSAEKKSWKERDAQKKSRFVDQEPQEKSTTFESRRANSQAMAALNDFFKGKKSKEMETHWKKVLEGKGKLFSSRAIKYVEEFGLPNEWDDLLRLLDHDTPGFVLDVLKKMMGRIPDESPLRKDLLVGKLRVLKMERDEPELINEFEESLRRLA